LRLEKFDLLQTDSQIAIQTIAVLGLRDIHVAVLSNREIIQTLLQAEAIMESCLRSFERTAAQFKRSAPDESTPKKVGYLRDYLLGISMEMSAVIPKFLSYVITTSNLTNEYTHNCIRMYEREAKQ